MCRLRSRCRVTGFVTGNLDSQQMKGLAIDVESMLKVSSLHCCCSHA